MPSSLRSFFSILVAALLLASPSFSFDHPLSDEAIREAYFLGQRKDERLAEFFDKYNRRPAAPESGPLISSVSFLTPYANAVDLSRQNSMGYSAQQAIQEYRKRGSIVRVIINIEFTASYSDVLEKPLPSRSNPGKGYQLRAPDFWRDFSYRLFQRDQFIEPRNIEGQATYTCTMRCANPGVLSGAIVSIYYDADKIDSAEDADVVVDTVNNQQIVVGFDLAGLR